MHSKGSPPPFLHPQLSWCQAAALRCKSIRSGRQGLIQAADKSDGQSVRQLQLFSPAGGAGRMGGPPSQFLAVRWNSVGETGEQWESSR